MQTYSLDLRRRVLEDCDAGMETSEVASMYDVSPAWVRRLKQRRRQTGEVAGRPRGGARRRVIDERKLTEAVEAKPDATLAELRDKLGLSCSLSGLCVALQRLKITLKKK
jgi:transposase